MRNTSVMFPPSEASDGVRIQILDSLGDLAGAWDDLVDVQPVPSPFLKSWWLSNAHGGSPAIVCVFRGDQLIGGAAFEVTNWGPPRLCIEKISVIGSGLLAPDHIDLICNDKDREIVARAVLGYLMRRGNRLIDLQGLSCNGTLAKLFSDSLTETFQAPFVGLPSEADEYLSTRPGKVRSTIKRRTKKFLADGATFVTVGLDDFDRAMKDFSELHDERWAEGSGFLDAFDKVVPILRDGLTKGEVLINELRLDSGETVAIEVDFAVAGRLSFYQSGRSTDHDHRGCGSALRFHIISDAIARGDSEYDMLRGEEPYKAEWANSARTLSNHRLAVGMRTKLLLGLINRAPWLSRR